MQEWRRWGVLSDHVQEVGRRKHGVGSAVSVGVSGRATEGDLGQNGLREEVWLWFPIAEGASVPAAACRPPLGRA